MLHCLFCDIFLLSVNLLFCFHHIPMPCIANIIIKSISFAVVQLLCHKLSVHMYAVEIHHNLFITLWLKFKAKAM